MRSPVCGFKAIVRDASRKTSNRKVTHARHRGRLPHEEPDIWSGSLFRDLAFGGIPNLLDALRFGLNATVVHKRYSTIFTHCNKSSGKANSSIRQLVMSR